MWFGLAKMALQAGAKVYSNKQRTKMAMSDAALMHAERMDEFVLLIISAPIIVLAWGVFSDDAQMMQKVELFFHHFGSLPIWFQTLWITVVASIFGIKGTQVFRNGGPKAKK